MNVRSVPVKVAIVEDHPEFREALYQALSAESDFQLLPVCKDLPAGQQLLAHGQSPLHAQLARAFLQREPAAAYEAATRALLQYIAAGYTGAEAATQLALPAADADLMLRRVYELFFQRGPDLSPRELELLQLLNKGLLFKQCAERMGVSESTTRTQAASAYQKLGASNLQAALYEARAANLLA